VRKRTILLVALSGGFIGIAFAWSGLFNVAASSGHFKLTAWFLHYVMRQSVKTHAFGIKPPNVEDMVLVRRGGAHFETACAFCHGSPIADPNPVALQMTPAPPSLRTTMDDWRPQELFWIVKHGIKYTGMPAWPAQDRDDELWAMVAFLRKLPSMTDVEYRKIAFGASLTGSVQLPGTPAQLKSCMRCHGEDGRGDEGGAFPRLDIQSRDYLIVALRSYVDGERQSGIMEAAAAGLGSRELDALAAYFARSSPQAASTSKKHAGDPLILRGRQIAERGIPDKRIPACADCHPAGGDGRDGRPEFPRLEGQYDRYLLEQLTLFAEEKDRGGTRFSSLMTSFAHRLGDEDRRAVAIWYASLKIP